MPGILGNLPGASSVLGTGGGGTRVRPRGPKPPAGGAQADEAPPSPTQTFQQLQQQGLARPAPPQAPAAQPVPQYTPSAAQQQTGGQLQSAVSQALATPSPYNSQVFNSLRDSATADLNQQFGLQREATDTDLARRGLSASTFAGNALHDVDAAQARAMANLNASLLGQAATTQGAYQQGAINSGLGLDAAQSQQGLAGYQANLGAQNQGFQQQLSSVLAGQSQYNADQQRALSAAEAQGNLGIAGGQLDLAAGEAVGNVGGHATLGAKQQDLAQTLGLGNLRLQQQQVSNQASQFGQSLLEQQAARAQQGSQFGQQQALEQAKQSLNEKVQTGQLSLAQAQQQLAELQNTQQYGLATTGQQIQQQQFGQTLAEQQAARGQQGSQFSQSLGEQGRQFDASQSLASQLGLGNLDIAREQANTGRLAQQAQAGQFQQQFGLSQQLGLANLSLDQAKQALNEKVQTGQLSLAQAQQALAERSNQQQFGLQQAAITGQYGGKAFNGDNSWMQTAQQFGDVQGAIQQAADAGVPKDQVVAYLKSQGKTYAQIQQAIQNVTANNGGRLEFGSAPSTTLAQQQLQQQGNLGQQSIDAQRQGSLNNVVQGLISASLQSGQPIPSYIWNLLGIPDPTHPSVNNNQNQNNNGNNQNQNNSGTDGGSPINPNANANQWQHTIEAFGDIQGGAQAARQAGVPFEQFRDYLVNVQGRTPQEAQQAWGRGQ